MPKDNDALIIVGIVIALVVGAFGIWWIRLNPAPAVTESDMEKARNADTSNFDTVLRF
jgi:hypothetical protein